MIVQILGYIATIGTILSFGMKDQKKLRVLNGIACVLWIVYGIGIGQLPIVIVNSCILILNGIWLWENREYQIGNKTKDKLQKMAGIKEYDKDKGVKDLATIIDKNPNIEKKEDVDFMYHWIRSKSGK